MLNFDLRLNDIELLHMMPKQRLNSASKRSRGVIESMETSKGEMTS